MTNITDEQGRVLATVEVTERAPGRFEGVVLHANFPEGLVVLPREFERLANAQVFPLLDELGRKIRAYKLRWAEGNAMISELQLWGHDGIHFWVEDAGVLAVGLAEQRAGKSLASATGR